MAEISAMNSDNKSEQAEETVEKDIKKEVVVKAEPHECLVCVNQSQECFDINVTKTHTSGASLQTFLSKFTQTDLNEIQNCSKFVCKNCFELINILEQTEIEYIKLKETFESIISKNPLFETAILQPVKLSTVVKTEVFPDVDDDCDDESVHFGNLDEDSEDEPLIRNKRKRRKTQTRKKKSSTSGKRKLANKNNEDRWECDLCGLQEETGGEVAETAHKLAVHAMGGVNPVIKALKTEDSGDGSQSPYNNGFSSCISVEFEHIDNDDSNLSVQENKIKSEKKRKLLSHRKSKLVQAKKTKKQKVMHQCDQCDSRYSTLSRLEQHKLKHDGSKPPYICEICGAHYKHKKACDIHIALHKGIGDWKCEECNRLFPSKNALQRHNNIHTGKLNYQCDLCGKSFIHTSSFKMHKLAHSGVKPHSCDVCGLALMTRSHLKRHKRIHSGEKRHECPICGKRFSERYNLAAHSKSHQQAAAAAADDQQLQQQQQQAAVARRRFFRCSFCPERFERRYMLERHTSAVHGRTLERPPPTPRNTMSKLLKAQALTRRDAPAAPHPAPHTADTADTADTESESKEERSPDNRNALLASQKLIAQLSSSTSIIASGSWSGAYAAEFGIRPEFPH